MNELVKKVIQEYRSIFHFYHFINVAKNGLTIEVLIHLSPLKMALKSSAICGVVGPDHSPGRRDFCPTADFA